MIHVMKQVFLSWWFVQNDRNAPSINNQSTCIHENPLGKKLNVQLHNYKKVTGRFIDSA
jgi:hypothetical protein